MSTDFQAIVLLIDEAGPYEVGIKVGSLSRLDQWHSSSGWYPLHPIKVEALVKAGIPYIS